MDTDHRYTLSLTLGTALQQNSHVEGGTIQRFRVGRLSQPEMKAKIISLIQQETNPFNETDDVEVMNTQLVQFCQRVQEQTVGKVRSRTLHQPQEPPNASPKSTLATSIRLYKQACTASKENDVVFPTAQAQAEGIDAMAENLAILRKRWSGQPFQIPAHDPSQQPIEAWTVEDVAAEIEQQESEKSCGADGIHIQFLKVVKETGVTTWLQQMGSPAPAKLRCNSRPTWPVAPRMRMRRRWLAAGLVTPASFKERPPKTGTGRRFTS